MTAPRTRPRSLEERGRVRLLAVLVTLVVLAAASAVFLMVRGDDGGDDDRDPAPRAEATGTPSPTPTPMTGCTVDERLVNSCRPWFGATANRYPQAEKWNKTAQLRYFERRTGRRLDVAHNYHPAGENSLDDTDRYFASRPDTLMLVNWQPTLDWSRADGSDPEVNAGIDEMGRSIKSLGRTRIMLALFHEPENDVSEAPSCPKGTPINGESGTPEEYRTMWRTVHERFDALGVDNVVWVMNYMGYPAYNCMIDALYPGDDLVDWILFNAYAQGHAPESFEAEVRNMYDLLTRRSGPRHDYLSKPWGLAEWGIYDSSQEAAYLYYEQAREAVEADTFPQLKLFAVFDSVDPHTLDGSYRVAYGRDGTRDRREQRAFNRFAQSWRLNGPWEHEPRR
ncbi:glycosyl hydrolase [Nocardioides caldifontis]|uniref:glycosyl hydrolase n=1 Tax=Nocardioides caldifontis TaxID=2588938 RepID=UPI0013968A02|nr:glycosyl hydrolase [Nocardioides caldifontis]